MPWRNWVKTLFDFLRPGIRQEQKGSARKREPITHVIILDGTMSSLDHGSESNAGLTYKLLSSAASPDLTLYYEAGLQWQDWRATGGVLLGRGINRQIRRAYGYLASRYRPGDRIFLFGYSRGAFAVRSLAGIIDRIGLLQSVHATQRNVTTAYRHYRHAPDGPAAQAFGAAYCHPEAPIEMVGIWDTVKALGLRLPVLWRFFEDAHAFHSYQLGPSIRHGFHALALDETRAHYTPVLWDTTDAKPDQEVQQVWFRGSHGDVGGHLGNFEAARPLSNIPLVWMLEHAELCGLPLPEGWQAAYPTDASAPSVGTWRGWGKIFLKRAPRKIGADPSERLHPSVPVGAAPAPLEQPAL